MNPSGPGPPHQRLARRKAEADMPKLRAILAPPMPASVASTFASKLARAARRASSCDTEDAPTGARLR